MSSRLSRSVGPRIGLLAILPLLLIGQWKYGHDADPFVRLKFVSDDGHDILYTESRFHWLHHRGTEPFDEQVLTLVRKSPTVVTRHVLSVNAYADVQVSPDGTRVAAVTPMGLLAMYDVTTGRALNARQLPIGRAEFVYVYFSRDGQYLAAQAFLDDRSLLQVMEADTLQVTHDVGSQWTISHTHRFHRLVVGNLVVAGSSAKLIDQRFATIEAGQLRVSDDSLPEHSMADISRSGRYLLRWHQRPDSGWQIIDRQTGTSSRFIPIASTAAVMTQDESTVLIVKGDQVLRVDRASGERLSTLQLDAELDFEIHLSGNGQFMAVHTRTGAIEVWDVTAGTRIRKLPDALRRWTLWAAGVLGTMAWCGAWLASGWRQRTTIGVSADILLASIVGGIGLYLRRLFAGNADALDRPAVIGTLAITFGISLLGVFWLVHGKGRWSWRLSAFLAGIALVWSIPAWIWRHFELPGGHLPLHALGTGAFAILLLTVLRRRGFQLVSIAANSPCTATGRADQFPLRDLMLLPGAIGLFIVVAKLVGPPTNLVPWLFGFSVLWCVCQAVIGIVAMHTTLSTRLGWRVVGGLLAIATLSVVAPLAFYGAKLWPWWSYAATDVAIGLYVLLSLLLVRRQGWRLNRHFTGNDRARSVPAT